MKSFFKKYYISLGRFRALYLISAGELCVIIIWSLYTGDGMSCIDTQNYYEAYDVILKGKLDIHRTPLYPLIIGISRTLFGPIYSIASLYFLQSILFLLSIKWLGCALMSITHFRRISYWFTAIYALYPGALSFCGIMLTESIAVSLVTAILYLISGAYYHSSNLKAFLSGIVCFLLWLLRPSMMCISVLITIFWAILFFFSKIKQKKTMLWGFSTSLMSLIFLVIYSIVFQNEYNISGVSAVSTWNNYMTIRGANAIDIADIESVDMKIDIDSMIEVHDKEMKINYDWWNEMIFLNKKYGLSKVNSFVMVQMKENPKKIISFLYHERMDDLLNSDCVYLGRALPYHVTSISRLVRVNNGTAFLIFFVGLIILFLKDFNQRRISYFVWLLFSIFFANYFTVWVAAPDDFPRLLAQNYPVLIAISCWVLDRLCILAISSNNTNSLLLSSDTLQSTK